MKLFKIGGWAGTALYAASYITIGYDILRKAFRGIINHQVFDENFLMAVATVGAIALAIYEKTGDFAEAVSVMLRRRQEPQEHRRIDGYPSRLRQYRKGRKA